MEGGRHSFPQKTQFSLIYISVSDGKHIRLKHFKRNHSVICDIIVIEEI